METIQKMLILAVETATSQQSVSILEENTVLGVCRRDVEGSHTRWLIPSIDELLTSLSLEMVDISGLALSIGPGSFTGLRAGLSTMLGFRLAFDLPLVTISTLEGMAWNYHPNHEMICPMLKARAGEVYWACFRWEGEALVRMTDDQAGSLSSLIDYLQEPAWVFGEGWTINQHEWLKRSDMFKPLSSEIQEISAASIGLASLERFRVGDVAPRGIAPQYVLPPYASLMKSTKKPDP